MTDALMIQFLLVAIIFSLLLVYWEVKDLPKKRKYRHTRAYLLKNK